MRHRTYSLSPDAVAAFKAGDRQRLHRALDLAPDAANPLDVDPVPDGDSTYRQSWKDSRGLREIMCSM